VLKLKTDFFNSNQINNNKRHNLLKKINCSLMTYMSLSTIIKSSLNNCFNKTIFYILKVVLILKKLDQAVQIVQNRISVLNILLLLDILAVNLNLIVAIKMNNMHQKQGQGQKVKLRKVIQTMQLILVQKAIKVIVSQLVA
jgi:hypothetical protein